MDRFEAAFTKRLSLDSNTFNRRLLSGGDEKQQSSEKNILRYSYNLGKQRGKLHRTASIGDSVTQTVDGNLAKLLLNRRELPRSLSMESQIGQTTRDNTIKVSIQPHLTKQFSMHADDKWEDELVNKNDTEKYLSVETDLSPEDITNKVVSEAREKEIVANDMKTTAEIHGKLHHSDSVPDLRFSANRLEREDFSGIFTSEIQTNESRPVCKLRRAARRLGVSLSSEDLYHRQRRNGVCIEIDDAAENRKLLRVLNKRF